MAKVEINLSFDKSSIKAQLGWSGFDRPFKCTPHKFLCKIYRAVCPKKKSVHRVVPSFQVVLGQKDSPAL